MESLGFRIKLAREAKDLSQAGLSKLLGLKSQAVISNWEANINKPDLDKFLQLCDILDVAPSALLNYNGRENSPPTIEQREILNKLDDLDEQGYRATIKFLDEQHDRVMNMGPNSTAPQQPVTPLYAWVSEEPSFLADMFPKCKEIRQLMKETHISAEDVTRYLWRIGYGGEICLFTILCIVREKVVPNEVLANTILDYLNMSKQLQEKHR